MFQTRVASKPRTHFLDHRCFHLLRLLLRTDLPRETEIPMSFLRFVRVLLIPPWLPSSDVDVTFPRVSSVSPITWIPRSIGCEARQGPFSTWDPQWYVVGILLLGLPG